MGITYQDSSKFGQPVLYVRTGSSKLTVAAPRTSEVFVVAILPPAVTVKLSVTLYVAPMVSSKVVPASVSIH
jgi:hypothetical protein